jgi:molecular chaperone DnaJ
MKDYYSILGVEKDAEGDEIKSAYRKLAKQYHPDVSKEDGSEEKFKEITEAYEVLSDSDKRRNYDLGDANGVNLNDIFMNFHRGAYGGGTMDFPQQGNHIKFPMPLTYKEIITKDLIKDITVTRQEECAVCKEHPGLKEGASKHECNDCRGQGRIREVSTHKDGMQMIRETICYKCNGTGKYIDKDDVCPECKGTASVEKERTFSVKIPRGIHQNQVIAMQGEGNCGKNGGPNGDIYVIAVEQPHEIFERYGDDVFLKLPITISQAVLGSEVELPTVYDNIIKVEIPAGSVAGTMVKKSDYGMPIRGHATAKGNMVVGLNIIVPENLTDKEKALFEKIRNIEDKKADKRIEKIEEYIERVRNVQEKNSNGTSERDEAEVGVS